MTDKISRLKICKWREHIICKASDYTYKVCTKDKFDTCKLRAINPAIQNNISHDVMQPPTAYPIIEYITLNQSNVWWSVVMLVRDKYKHEEKAFIRLVKYKRIKRKGELGIWVNRSAYNIKSIEEWERLKSMIDNNFIGLWKKWIEDHPFYSTTEELEKDDDVDVSIFK